LAQEANPLRPVESVIPSTYNIKLGSRTFLNTGAGVEFSFNDNITLTRKNRKSEFTIAPAIQFGFIHSFSKQDRIRLALDISYVKHFNYPDLDHFSITPNGGNDFEVSLRVGERWILRASDTFSISRSSLVRNTSIGVGGVTIFNNAARLSADADYNNFTLLFAYTNNLGLSLDGNLRNLDTMSHTGEASIGFRLSKPVLLGIKSSVSYLDSLSRELNNGISYSGQVFGNFVITRTLTATASTGYQITLFDNSATKYKDDSDYGNIVFNFGLSHELSRSMQHSVAVSRGMQPGLRSNYQDTMTLSYNISYSYTRYLTLDFIFDWLSYEDSKGFKGRPANSGDNYSLSLGGSYALSRFATLVAKYQFRWSDANNDGGFYNNIITLAINSRF